MLTKSFHKGNILGKANAVGIDHDIVDRLRQSVFYNLLELRMGRRFSARDLQDIGFAFGSNQRIDCGERLRHRFVFESRSTICIVQWAGQVAVVRDFENRDAGMLLVFAA